MFVAHATGTLPSGAPFDTPNHDFAAVRMPTNTVFLGEFQEGDTSGFLEESDVDAEVGPAKTLERVFPHVIFAEFEKLGFVTVKGSADATKRTVVVVYQCLQNSVNLGIAQLVLAAQSVGFR